MVATLCPGIIDGEKMSVASTILKGTSIKLKILLIAIIIYGFIILGGYLLGIILIIRGKKPPPFIALVVNLVIFIVLVWVFLLQKRKSNLREK